jgi:chemotaxis protein histidine kinase CheA
MIKGNLKPKQGIKVGLKTVYVYDTEWVTEVDNAITSAKESEANAKASELNAKRDATSASNSANSASSSASAALASASSAGASAQSASSSASSSKTYKEQGEELKNETSTYLQQTKSSEQSAREHSAISKTSATNAKTSETNAKTSENNALSYKNSAQSSATSAQTSAQNAANSATTATNAANSSNVQTVVTNMSAINTCSSNIALIKDAPNQANRAKQYADQAQAVTEGTLNETQITNCITEIPQDIKLELNNGTLTLKAGSKVYVPNGAGKFDEVVISTDYVLNNAQLNGTNAWVLALNGGGTALFPRELSKCVSGAGATTSGGYAYDTTTNIISWYNASGVEQSGNCSLPLCRFSTTSGVPTSIDQVFNGFGYIGSTVFALPGVKGLIPNGRNADGSLRNIEFTLASVKTDTRTNDTANTLVLSGNGISQQRFPNGWNYDAEKNIVYSVTNKAQRNYCVVGQVSSESIKITTFQPKITFRAVDYNDFEKLEDEAVKITGNQDIRGNKTFIDTLKAPTPSSATDNSTNVATTAWVSNHRCKTQATTASTASVNAPAYIVENYYDASTGDWYRVWSDGWIEQGFSNKYIGKDTYASSTITWKKPFNTTDYVVAGSCSSITNSGNDSDSGIITADKTTTTCVLKTGRAFGDTYVQIYACGY